MKVDLHTHGREHSACSVVWSRDLARQAASRGLDALAITDHHHFLDEDQRDALGLAVPELRVFRGIEITIEDIPGSGLTEDVLVISSEPVGLPSPLPALHVDRLAAYAARTGALTVLAHPFRFHRRLAFDLDRFTPDAVEVASVNIEPRQRRRILSLARRHGMWPVATSDAHTCSAVGLYYIELDEPADDEYALAQAVRAGYFRLGAYLPGLRDWAPHEPRGSLARAVLSWGGDMARYLAGA